MSSNVKVVFFPSVMIHLPGHLWVSSEEVNSEEGGE